MNIVDGIFGEQLGVHLDVAQIVEAPEPDPFTSNDPQTLRAALADYKNGSPTLRKSRDRANESR